MSRGYELLELLEPVEHDVDLVQRVRPPVTLHPSAQADAREDTPTRADVTATGTVVGTPPYMSPEQVRGTETDARADVRAFGALFFEMLTGRQPFAGGTSADVMSAILERDPDMSLLPSGTPELVGSLLRRCLQKDPRRRLRDIGDARLELDDAMRRATGPQAPVD